jgi:NAD(P)-dependent dehydrogenase (short-subunit alcohol dehydrogenase family)
MADAGGVARALPMHLTDPASIAAAAADVAGAEGRIDVLVHNAGQTQRALVADAGIDIYRRLFEVNFFGPLALTKAALPVLQGGGRIVVVSSIAAYYSSPYRSGYNASKKALHGLFDAFRAEAHRDGISVLLVVLGGVRTRVSINALRGDGSAYGRMDPAMAAGMDPARVADDVARGWLSAERALGVYKVALVRAANGIDVVVDEERTRLLRTWVLRAWAGA